MKTLPRLPRALFGLITLGLVAPLLLTGCDSGTANGGDETRISGQVTDDAGYGKRAAGVEGATVTAVTVDADGQISTSGGTATTDAEGRYTLDTEVAADVYLAQAEHESGTYRTLVYAGGQSSVTAQPMTNESRAEADIYVEAKETDEDEVTIADVAAHVDQRVTAAVDAGQTTEAEVAEAVRAGVEAEFAYLDEQDGDAPDEEEVRDEKEETFLELQSSLAAATSTSAETGALVTFEESLAQAFVEAGASAETQAHARQSGGAALVRFNVSGDAGFALRQRSAILTAIATAQAIEAEVKAAGASTAQVNALAQARQNLVTNLRAATSAQAMTEAQASYRSTVHEELAAILDVSANVVAGASAAIGTARTAFETALQLATSATAVASLYATFVTSAEASVAAQLATSANAEAGATVLVLIEGMASAN